MKIGDRVRVIDDGWEGAVIGVSANKLDGFVTVKFDEQGIYMVNESDLEFVLNKRK
jgi:hypothetical protein